MTAQDQITSGRDVCETNSVKLITPIMKYRGNLTVNTVRKFKRLLSAYSLLRIMLHLMHWHHQQTPSTTQAVLIIALDNRVGVEIDNRVFTVEHQLKSVY